MESSSKIHLSINDFSGPLELLYQLVKERKYDIMNLDLNYVVDEYVNYIVSNFESIKTDSIIDDLLMITYFIELRSKKILPNHDNDHDLDREIEKDKFIQRLLLQKQFKEIVPTLNEKYSERIKMQNRIDDEIEKNKNIYIDDANLPESISPKVLLKALQRVYKKIDENKNDVIKRIDIKELSIDDVIEEIITVLKSLRGEKISLFLLFNSIDIEKVTKQYMAVAFVAILVLAKHSFISLKQDSNNDEDIYISLIDIDKNFDFDLSKEFSSTESQEEEIDENNK